MNTTLLYSLLGVLELVFVVSGLAVWLWLRNRRAGARIAELESALAEVAPTEPEPVVASEAEREPQQHYVDFLGLEIEASTRMLGPQTDEQAVGDDRERRMLAARHQFLQMELDAERMGKDPEAKRRHIVEGMEALLATLFPGDEAEAAAEPAAADVAEMDDASLGREQQLEDQIAHLRSVIDNQHEVMRDLRELLEETFDGSEEVQAMIHRLETAGERAQQVQRALEAVGMSGFEGASASHEPDADMLRDLVSNQQRTIDDLKRMLHEAVSDGEVAQELEEAMGRMQRANQELGMCVSVLEDENAHLRDEVEELRAQVEALQDGGSGEAISDAGQVAEAATTVPPEATDGAETMAEAESAEASSAVDAVAGQQATEAERVEGVNTGGSGAEADVDALPESGGQADGGAVAMQPAADDGIDAPAETQPADEDAGGETASAAAGDDAVEPVDDSEVLSDATQAGASDMPDAEIIDGVDATTAPGGHETASGESPDADTEREVVMPVGSNLDLAEEAAKENSGAGEKDRAGEPDAYDIDALIDGALRAGDDLDADLREAGKS